MTGELLSGHTIKYTNFAYLDKPGSTSNTFSFVISNEDGEVLYSSADSSNENSIYSVTVEYGTLKVRQVEITVITGNAEKVYDGTPLTNSDYRVEGELLAGHEIRVTVTGTITEIGSIENTFEYVIVDAQGKEIEAPYYLINEELGVLRVLEEKTNPGGSKPSDPPPKAPLPGATPEGPAVPVIEVTADYSGPILLRDAHYGDYEYDYWDIAPAGESKNGLYFTSEAYKYVGANAQTVQIKLLSSAYVLPYYTDKDSVGEVATEYTVQNYYTTQNNLEHSAEWKALEENYREFVYDNYTDLPEETKSQVYTIIMNALNESGAEALILNRYELIYWIESYVRNVAPYDREYPVPSGVDLAVWFLSDPEAAGVCRHFATAAVAAYRALGIPARYVTGYSGTVQNGKTVTITSEQAHAWVEVYYDGIGWLAVDPTGSGNGSGGGGGPLPRPPIEEEEVITDVYIEFKSENVKFTYDGKSHGLDSSMVAAPRTAPKALGGKVIYLDDSLEYEFYGEITEVGSIAAGIKSVRAYDIETGLDVSYKYNFHYNDTIDIIITQIPLNIKSESKITPKDELGSRPLTYNILSDKEFQASSGQTARNISEILLSGHEIVAEFTASLSDYGKTDNVFTVRVFDEYGNDVTKYYAISYRYGTLTVAYDRLVYKTNSYSKEYDKTALVGDVTIADLMNPYDGYIRAGHYIDTASFANASVLTPETKNNIPKFKIRNEYGVDITDLYVIDQSMLGKLTVNPINVTVAAGSKSVDYDPKNPNKKLVCDSYEIVSGKLLEGHRIVATYEGEISKPGLCDSSIKSIKIYDENGNDVTSVYRISTQTGVLEIVA